MQFLLGAGVFAAGIIVGAAFVLSIHDRILNSGKED